MSLIVLLGMHRSGTSATAGLITHFDYFPGHQLILGDEFNKKGYFEDKKIVAHNKNLLQAMDLVGWQDAGPAKKIEENNGCLNLIKQTKKVFLDQYSEKSNKVLKDPRVCRTLPFWLKTFDEIKERALYIFTLRNPDDIIKSLLRRSRVHPNHSALLYAAYLIDAERHSRGQVRALVRYEDLLNKTRDVLGELDNRLGTAFLAADPKTLSDACSFLALELNHKSDALSIESSIFIDFAHEVYKAFDRHFYDASPAVFDQLQDKLDTLRAMLEPWLAKSARIEAMESQIFVPGQAIYDAASQNAYATVYWKTPSLNYLQSRSLVQPCKFGGDEQTLVFSLPATPDRFLSLRLDLTDRPALCEVREISLNDAMGGVRWTAKDRHDFVNISADMRLFFDEGDRSGFTVISTGFDPKAELAIPEAILTEAGEGWTLTAKVKFRLLSEGVPGVVNRLQSSIRQADNAQQALKTSIAEVSSLKMELAEKNSALQKQASESDALRVQLLRAEAQLELLKDLMISGSELDRL
ncbi:sulfotransferase [Macromonas bipunctata]|uniref:sulfotransferase n=1 Tax=Macromonas bipunctata TaxID=183670 RepID=UPI0011AEEAC7|nr:sulfotransferase [Macromonas bipunctata]